VQLLKAHGVTGSDRRNLPLHDGDAKSERVSEFEKLVEDVKGHALTLNLLGTYLRDAHAGDIRKRGLVKLEEADANHEHKHHAFHVMDAYVKWLAPSGFRAWLRRLISEKEREHQTEGKRALALLRLMGLFDRPATADCLAALWKAPAIPGLNEPLIGFSDGQRNLSLKRLDDAKLLTVSRASGSGELVALDAHPLLREYFARRVREQQPEAWRAAHRRLYEHLCASTQEGDQPTLEALQPLYQAVAHGCQAGLQQEAAEKVYRARIKRRDENYSSRKLGAFGSDLGAVACFFEPPWNRLSPSLKEVWQAWLLNEAAFRLRALGRLTEALEPMRAGLDMGVKQEDWKEAAIRASNLSELELTLGEVDGAVGDAEQSVTYADRSGDAGQAMINRTTHADALHQAGHRAEAEARFREAEQMQADDDSDHPLLYSLPGFKYCDLLLAEAERAAWQRVLELRASVLECASPLALSGVASPPNATSTSAAQSGRGLPHSKTLRAGSERASKMFEWRTPGDPLLDIALDHLTLGRAALYTAILEGSRRREEADGPPMSPDVRLVTSAATELDAAVSGLRRAGTQDHLPRGLLTRAWQRSLTGALTSAQAGPDSAQSDLDEAWEIAERGPMPLFMADIHLSRARLFGMKKEECRMKNEEAYPWESPQHDLAEAERLIQKHGYHRRDGELADAKDALGL
jgi:tetratricopeptide (TPR) repeat protein